MFPSVDISSDTFIHNSNPDPNPNPNPNPSYFYQEHHDAPPLMFSNFPSPFFDDQSDFFSLQHNHHIFQSDEIISPKNDLGTDQAQASVSLAADPPQRKMRKDRHSKICTAQGVRARRMRLPLQIARKFFDLQDMLGYDKPSKTIEWLMSKSKGAIREITKNIPGSSRSEKGFDSSDSLECHGNKKKELREKARERARERTREKMRMRMKLGCSASPNLDSPFDSSTSHQSLNKQFSNVGISADCLVSRFDHNENIILGGFDYNNMNNSNSFTEFLENWELENS